MAMIVALAAGCGDGGAEPGAGPDGGAGSTPTGEVVPVVVATTSIWADVVANVTCGDLAEVRTLIPTGADPHGFEPSLADRGRLGEASLIVANGLGLEEGIDDVLGAVEAEGVPVFRIAEHIDTIAYSGLAHGADDDHADDDHADAGQADDDHGADDDHDADADHGDDDEHGHGDHEGTTDPHVWFDPIRVEAVLPELVGRLVEEAGLDETAVQACADRYGAELADVDAEIADLVTAVPDDRRLLVTSHDSLGYFADRYGFEIVGTVLPVPSGLAETNPAALEELAALMEQVDVDAIFTDTQHAIDDSVALADRVGDVEIVVLRTGTLGEPGSGSATYVELLLTTAELITEALA